MNSGELTCGNTVVESGRARRRPIALFLLVIIFSAAIGALGGHAYYRMRPPKYVARCTYQMFREEALNYGFETTLEKQASSMHGRLQVLRSDVLAERARNRLERSSGIRRPENPAPEVAVEEESDGRLVISVKTDDREYAVAFLREPIRGADEMYRLDQMEATERSLRSLRLERDRLSNELEDVWMQQKELEAKRERPGQEMQTDMRQLRKVRELTTEAAHLEKLVALLTGRITDVAAKSDDRIVARYLSEPGATEEDRPSLASSIAEGACMGLVLGIALAFTAIVVLRAPVSRSEQ